MARQTAQLCSCSGPPAGGLDQKACHLAASVGGASRTARTWGAARREASGAGRLEADRSWARPEAGGRSTLAHLRPVPSIATGHVPIDGDDMIRRVANPAARGIRLQNERVRASRLPAVDLGAR